MPTQHAKSWRYVVYSAVAVVALAIAVFLSWLFAPPRLVYRSELRTGNLIVWRVEAYRGAHGYVPDDLGSVGMDEQNLNVYYRKESSQKYVVWFGTTLGESMTYDSDSRKWQ